MSGLTRVNRNNTERDRSTPAPTAGPGAGFRASPSPYGGGASSSPYGTSSPFPGAASSSPYGAGPGSGFSTPGGGAGSRSEYSESPFGGGMRSSAGVGQAHDLEQHNDDLLKGLLGKVDVLKNLSIGIGDEVRAGNLELSGMTDTFGSTGAYLKGTYRRMMKMAGRQGSTWCWFMAFMVLVFVIFILVWFVRR